MQMIRHLPSGCPFCEPPQNASSTVREAVAWLKDVAKLLITKNQNYGDSAANPVRIFSKASPIEQLLVRIDDKLSRAMRGAGVFATDEDLPKDLVGYLALLGAMTKKGEEK